jgi:plastocyanin
MRIRPILTLVAVALVAVACGGDTSDTSTTAAAETTTTTTAAADTTTTGAGGGETATITIAGFSFGEVPTVSVGDTVVVENTDGAGHTWTAQDGTFDSGTLGSGDSFEFTFTESGEYDFFCQIHPSMTGTITVDG